MSRLDLDPICLRYAYCDWEIEEDSEDGTARKIQLNCAVMTKSQARFRIGVDIGATFIDRQWSWFAMAIATDPETRLAQCVPTTDADQDDDCTCRLEELRLVHRRRFRRSRRPFPGLK